MLIRSLHANAKENRHQLTQQKHILIRDILTHRKGRLLALARAEVGMIN